MAPSGKEAKLTQELLRQHFDYNPETGELVRLFAHQRTDRLNKPAGHVMRNGYRMVNFLRAKHYAHRLIWLWVYGSSPDMVDHINRIKSDNRLENLRAVSRSMNCLNQEIQTNNTSGVIGVCWSPSRNSWQAALQIDGRYVLNKSAKSFDEAVRLRADAERAYLGEFSCHRC